MPSVTTAGAIGAGLLIMVAQVILPAAIDLVGSAALLGLGAFVGWKAGKGQP